MARLTQRTDTEQVAAFAFTLATQLRGGTALHEALTASTGQTATRRWQQATHESILRERIARGVSPVRALADEAPDSWRVLAAAWAIAQQTGAPMSLALERVSHSLLRLAALARRRDVLTSGPRASVLLIACMPLGVLLIAELLGLSAARALVTPLGLVSGALGLMLLVAGVAWGLAMIRGVRERDTVSGFAHDLLWLALGGGAAPEAAARLVVDAVVDTGASWVRLDDFAVAGPLGRITELAARVGVPVRDLVIAEADSVRDAAFADLEQRAEQLAVRTLLPMGLCVLPAFICLGVVPVLLGMLAV